MGKTSRFFTLFLTLAILFSAVSAVGIQAATEEKTVTIDFSKASPFDGAYFKASEGWSVTDGALQNPGTAAVYSLQSNSKIAQTGAATLELDLKAPFRPEDTSPWMSAYIGFRLASAESDATSASGLWFAIRGTQLGIRTGNWPETSLISITEDYTDYNYIKFVDDQDNNVITVYGQGERNNVLARVEIDGANVKLYAAEDEFPSVEKSLPYTVGKGGHVSVWVHNIPNVGLKKATLTYPEFKKEPYVPADPAKIRDTYADTWVATDDEGRTMPTYEEVGEPDDSKQVGMFYFLWHNHQQGALFDHYKTYKDAGGGQAGVDAVWQVIPQGNLGYAHYWAEPYFGYYRSDDEWVIRKHATMLVNAGVDFIFFDCSNGVIYPEITSVIFKVYKQMREEGLKTPQFMYFLGDRAEFAADLVPTLYNDMYKTGDYSDMWVMLDGKPLILGNFSQITDETLKNTFTVRRSWAFESGEAYQDNKGKGTWLWADVYPQAPGYSPDGQLEQMIVMSGFWANGNGGRSNVSTNSYHGTEKVQATNPGLFDDFGFGLVEDGTSGKGLAYQEHWDYANEIDPPVIMITGWNEWWAGRWENDAHGQQIANTYVCDRNDPVKKHYYVDAFNPEFSRDTEPMRGGYGDNYYYQTVMNIRRYKGVRPIPVNYAEGAVAGLAGWDKVYPEYRDTLYDTAHRNKIASAGNAVYVNETGRNDFDYAKVAFDDENILFYVQTRDAITAAEGENWMNLFIDIDKKAETGWKGYDFVINRTRNGNQAVIEKAAGNGWSWTKVGEADYITEGNQMVITVPKAIVGDVSTFDFKWADNSTTTGEVMEFMDLGDAAPDDRFNFRVVQNTTGLPPEVLDYMVGSVAMAIGKSAAFSGYTKTAIDPDNAEVVPQIVNDRTLVPVRFIAENFNSKVEWDAVSQIVTITRGTDVIRLVINEAIIEKNGEITDIDTAPQIINDRTMVPLRAIVEAMDKTVYWNPMGLIIIGNEGVAAVEDAIAAELYQALE